jgi:hypothetical protein
MKKAAPASSNTVCDRSVCTTLTECRLDGFSSSSLCVIHCCWSGARQAASLGQSVKKNNATMPSTRAGIPSSTNSQRQPSTANHPCPRIQPAIGDPMTNDNGIAAIKLLVAFARSPRINQSDCAYRKSYSAVFTNVALLHCAQNLPQYQFARDRSAKLADESHESKNFSETPALVVFFAVLARVDDSIFARWNGPAVVPQEIEKRDFFRGTLGIIPFPVTSFGEGRWYFAWARPQQECWPPPASSCYRRPRWHPRRRRPRTSPCRQVGW